MMINGVFLRNVVSSIMIMPIECQLKLNLIYAVLSRRAILLAVMVNETTSNNKHNK